jgi:3-deoxy-D-manno-octulosonic-acid transferase
MRLVYTILFYLCLPLIILRLCWRSVKAPEYRQRWCERFGFFAPLSDTSIPCVWLHVVSVGEAIAAQSLVIRLLEKYPHHQFVITTTTPTGSAQVRTFFADYIQQGRIAHCYMPYDVPVAVQRFLSQTHPQLAIFMETEVWPNILAVCEKNKIPCVLINARMSNKSFLSYQKIMWLIRPAFARFAAVVAQTQEDGDRIMTLGSPVVSISGSIKSEITLSDDLIAKAARLKQTWSMAGKKKIILAASTHQGEDEIILSAYQALLAQHPHVLLVIVPRHPERFSKVKQLSIQQGLVTSLRSDGASFSMDTQVVVGDSMGELMLMYGAADIAIVGGSFIVHGGHNLVEPAVWGLPILSGKSVYNFAKIADDLMQKKALFLVDNQSQLVRQLDILLTDTFLASSMGEQARHYVNNSRGALTKTLDVLEKYIHQ